MEFIALIILILIAGSIWSAGHKSGKREGSRKGYGVGYDRGKRSNSGGCVVLIAFLAGASYMIVDSVVGLLC